jgi:hypothetical protein
MAGEIALVHSQVQEGGEAVKQEDVMACFVWLLLGMTLGGIAGGCTGTSQMKQEAVREGHAEWVADAGGMAQFKWKECK